MVATCVAGRSRATASAFRRGTMLSREPARYSTGEEHPRRTSRASRLRMALARSATTRDGTRDHVIAWARASGFDRGPNRRAGARRAKRTRLTVGATVTRRSQAGKGKGERTNDEHRITPRVRRGSLAASMRARGPENDQPRTKKSGAARRARFDQRQEIRVAVAAGRRIRHHLGPYPRGKGREEGSKEDLGTVNTGQEEQGGSLGRHRDPRLKASVCPDRSSPTCPRPSRRGRARWNRAGRSDRRRLGWLVRNPPARFSVRAIRASHGWCPEPMVAPL